MENDQPKRITFNPIRFEQIGIDESDIEACQSIERLQQWNIEVERAIKLVKSRMLALKIPDKSERTQADRVAYIKAERYRKLLAAFHQRLMLRIGILRKEAKAVRAAAEAKTYNEQIKDINHQFRIVAKEMLTKEQYAEIIKEADRRVNMQ